MSFSIKINMLLRVIETIAIIPTVILLFVILSQFIILIFKPRKKFRGKFKPSVSILVPAHNEGRYLRKTLDSILNCGYTGKKEIIVIDDGSVDNTPEIIEDYKKRGLIRSIRTNHIGKSKAMNKGLKLTKNEIIITIDGDTQVKKGSFDKLLKPFKDENVAATTGAIKIANTKKFLTWFQRVEYIYFSFHKSLCERINGTIFASGTLSAFRAKCLKNIGGFNPLTFSEDIDVALRLIKKGYKVHYVDEAVSLTPVPENVQDLAKQRFRWTRGGIQILKKYFNLSFSKKYKGPGFYSLPFLSYWYFHSVIMGFLLFSQIILGYYTYFYTDGVLFSFDVLKYFFYWFSIFGMINVIYQTLIGNFSLTILTVLNALVMIFTYAIFVYSMKWFKEKITLKDIIAYVFMFPYWLFLMVVQGSSNIEWVRKKTKILWSK